MNYFNSVFANVQQKCLSQGLINDTNQLSEVAQNTGLLMDRLYFYLSCLDEMDVIHFAPETKTVELTDTGKEVSKVFPHLVF
jgi:hypothetical protein